MIRDLIKKILKEETSKKITVEVLDDYDFNEIISESRAYVRVPYEVVRLVDSRIEDYNKGSGFVGQFYEDKTNITKEKKFLMRSTTHYIQRLFRTRESLYLPDGKLYDPRIEDPTIFEGIDLVYAAKDELTKLYFKYQKENNTLFGKNLLIKTYNPTVFSVILGCERNSTYKKSVELLLKTQIKGVEFNKKHDPDEKIDRQVRI